MQEYKPLITVAGFVLLVAGIAGAAAYYSATKDAPKADYTEFAKCLASKNVTMYGAVWCSHCANQKKLFGPAFKYVPYVECPDNVKLCTDKGVTGYPTWIFEDGSMIPGETTLEAISEKSSCPLPGAKVIKTSATSTATTTKN